MEVVWDMVGRGGVGEDVTWANMDVVRGWMMFGEVNGKVSW
jgi:hypothetical protein